MTSLPPFKSAYFAYVGLKNLSHIFTTGLPKTQRLVETGPKVPRVIFLNKDDAIKQALAAQGPGQRWDNQPVAILRFEVPFGVGMGGGWQQVATLQPVHGATGMLATESYVPAVYSVEDVLYLNLDVPIEAIDPDVLILKLPF